MIQCFFLVKRKSEKKGQNLIIFIDSDIIGLKARKAYFSQEKDKIINIQTNKYKYTVEDKLKFKKIDNIAVKSKYKDIVYPQICLRVAYKGRTYKY